MLSFDSMYHPYASRRMTTFARNGVVATSQPLAAQAGLDILKRGGNAVDAAIATAACLTVVEPTSNGIGSDAFAIVWMNDEMYGLNSSGPAPSAISIEAVKERGHEEMPAHGFTPVTVPGAPGAWAALSKRFGQLSLSEVLEPAVTYAAEGYPLSPVLARAWGYAARRYRELLDGPEFEPWFETFTPSGDAPQAGEMWHSPGHANTLKLIGETGARAFYQGELAEQIDAFSRQHDGFLRGEDLAAFEPQWVDPLHVNYRGYDVWELPPNGQGMIALIALNILKGFEFQAKDVVETYHRQIEAMKLAFVDGKEYITDPRQMPLEPADLLSERYAHARRALIGDEAIEPQPGQPPKGGTVYLATADGDGNMVSYIQSNYMGFGSGIVVPGTGISLQNRGHTFSLDPQDANHLEPGMRTYHTIIPGFLTRDDQAVGPFGVMGGYMQPQGHVQVIMNSLDFGLNPQAALDAPRWQWQEGKKVMVEHAFPSHLARALASRGHEISIARESGLFGRGQIIWRDPRSGVLAAGTEPRTDSSVAAW